MRPSLSRSPAASARPIRGTFHAGPDCCVTSTKLSGRSADQEQARHLQREIGPIVDHVAVRLREVEPAVVVDIDEDDTKAEDVSAGRGQPDDRGPVGENAVPPCS